MLPAEALQVTVLLELVPCTVAANCWLPFTFIEAGLGDIVIALTVAGDGGALRAVGWVTAAHPKI
jgi:hypothetical protein